MIKRKSDDDKVAAEAKRRVPFTAPKDEATKAIIVQNASCPLLRLPLEIRHEIWAKVLGDRLIHLEYIGKRHRHPTRTGVKELTPTFRHIVCKHDCPENEMVEESIWTNNYGEEEIVWRQPHHRCDVELAYSPGADPKQSRHESMHLKVLRVCRQIYDEANHVLWTTNTFSFNDAGLSFHRFMEERTIHQQRLLRRLRLQMDWVWGEDETWNRTLSMTLIRSLAGLRFLRLQINHSMRAWSYQEAKAPGNELGLFQTRHLEFVHKMAILPLVDVEVFVGDRSQPLNMDSLWTAADRMEYADGIRKILLDPRGAEKYVQEQEELKEFHQQDGEREKERQEATELAAAQAPLRQQCVSTTCSQVLCHVARLEK